MECFVRGVLHCFAAAGCNSRNQCRCESKRHDNVHAICQQSVRPQHSDRDGYGAVVRTRAKVRSASEILHKRASQRSCDPASTMMESGQQKNVNPADRLRTFRGGPFPLRHAALNPRQSIALALAFPCALFTAFGWLQSAFTVFAHIFAAGPGLPGDLLRSAYDKLTLTR